MAKYRRRPIDVEAVQFWPDQKPWPEGVEKIFPNWRGDESMPLIINLDNHTKVNPGDWIVTNQTGERYVVRKDSFDATYKKVEK